MSATRTTSSKKQKAVAGRIFFLDLGGGRVLSANPDGSDLQTIVVEGRKLPDGLAIDEDGGLAVAHLGLGCVWLFDMRGEPTARIRSCAGLATTNIAHGGAHRRKLYITESETGQVLVADVGVPGRSMFAHA